MSTFDVDRQNWRHWPKTVMVREAETNEERRYVPERTCHKLPQTSGRRCVVHDGVSSASYGYWTCSECGVECFEGARYCMGCGARLVEE